MDSQNDSKQPDRRRADQRLNSWKSIAAFFERDERTVKRWERQRSLPVHRIPGTGRPGVFAYTSELLEWLKTAGAEASLEKPSEELAGTALPEPVVPATQSRWFSSPLRGPIFLSCAVLAILGGLLFLPQRQHLFPRTAPAPYLPVGLKPAANREAQDLYLQGLYHWNKRTETDLNIAVTDFTQSIVHDPNYAPAYVGLANCYNLLREYSLMPAKEAYPRAIAAAQRAIALDDSLAQAHNALAFADFYWSWDAPGAAREFRRAIDLDPNSALAHQWYATFLMVLARFDESVAEIEQARKLDPTSSAILADEGLVFFAAGRSTESIALLKGLESSDPDFLSPHSYLAVIYLEMRDFKDYLPEAKKSALMLKDQNRLRVVAAAEKGFASAGGTGMLREMARVEQGQYAKGQIDAYELASIYSLLGDKQRALELLQISVQKREARVVAMRIDQNFDDLHDEPPFHELLAKVGLTPLPEGRAPLSKE